MNWGGVTSDSEKTQTVCWEKYKERVLSMIKGSASKTSLRGSMRIETKAKECLDLETIQDD
jgi:hypothetical protein